MLVINSLFTGFKDTAGKIWVSHFNTIFLQPFLFKGNFKKKKIIFFCAVKYWFSMRLSISFWIGYFYENETKFDNISLKAENFHCHSVMVFFGGAYSVLTIFFNCYWVDKLFWATAYQTKMDYFIRNKLICILFKLEKIRNFF